MSLREVLRPIGHPVMQVARGVKDIFRARQARKKLEYWQSHKTSNHKIPRIGFIMQMPACWDKIQPVFEMASKREDVEAVGIVVPDFEGYDIGVNEERRYKYGAEHNYFHNLYDNVIDFVKPDKKLIDVRDLELDYMFYQRPYEVLLPETLRAQNIINLCKPCYIPYGAIGAFVFEELELSCKDFFRAVTYNFVSSPHLIKGFERDKSYKKFIDNGLIKCLFYGYPNHEYILAMNTKADPNGYILWTPRWSYDKKVGGSNFFEYKEAILNIKRKFPKEKILIRPHPLMFKNFIREGRLSREEYENYIRETTEAGIEFDNNSNILDTLKETKIIITDFSSIIPDFFVANIPIIYCSSSNIELNEPYREIIETEYVINNYHELIESVSKLLCNGDSKREQRKDVIDDFANMHKDSSKKIIDVLLHDFY